ncbi:MarR family transcriptional regulator [Arthrobacter sp. Sa2BUA2]|uniref:MarR family transcriptional regulator n=1 Tax=Arthrobacter pullicola TaxID=2762224 RepID=A0ABR8YKL1_9MICC|nr:MarR family transcriptional regulator [Arthrobacter pullicola]MBD8044763.1 MarR family transcriptional regulator [Arthrobacter pullicola]
MSKGSSGAAGPESFPGDLAWNLGVTAGCYQSRLEEVLADMPGGLRGFQVVSAVVHHAPENQQALGARVGIDRTVLTYLLDTLVAAGAVERIPDPTDRRARKVIATAAGRQTLARCEQLVAQTERELLAALDGESGVFQTLIGRLAAFVQGSSAGRLPCAGLGETRPVPAS